MEKIIQNALLLLGLNAKEIKFFLTSFKLGPASVSDIVKIARLERSTAYLIYQNLIKKGFIEDDLKEYGKKVITIEPQKILRIVASKQRQLRRQELELEESLPELQSIYQASEIRPKVRVFESNNGLLSVWEDILSIQQELLLWTNQETETLFFNQEQHDKFIKIRIQKKIPIRVLALNNQKGRKLKVKDNESLRNTKLLPNGIDFSAETYIYGNKVAILDYKKDIIGIIIESEPIVKAQRAIFEMNWKLLE